MNPTDATNDQPLKTGDKGIDFELNNIDRVPYRLYETLEKRPVILVFYRGDW
jgi:peroxiredoxin